jgi:hypothetical protein
MSCSMFWVQRSNYVNQNTLFMVYKIRFFFLKKKNTTLLQINHNTDQNHCWFHAPTMKTQNKLGNAPGGTEAEEWDTCRLETFWKVMLEVFFMCVLSKLMRL